MHSIPTDHPRYVSLRIRQRMVAGWERGLAVPEGLLAHGRGEAFDYLLGEKTQPEARSAIRAAAADLLLAVRPVISVNGNAASLVPGEIVALARAVPGSVVEVNLFHRSEARARRIARELEAYAKGTVKVLATNTDARLPGLSSQRSKTFRRGMMDADLVFIPLEDGDRAGALKKAGKRVLAIDLNPLSRTARVADVTIVDNIVRALPELIRQVARQKRYPRSRLESLASGFDNAANLRKALSRMLGRLKASDLRF